MPHTSAERSTTVPGELLSVTTVRDLRPGRVVVEVVGEVDTCTAPLLAACLDAPADRAGVRELVVRLERVTFLGVAGLGVLARAHRRCRSRGARLVVRTGGRRCVLRPLHLVGLAGPVAVDPARADGLPTGPRTRGRPRAAPRRSPERRARGEPVGGGGAAAHR
ncbi:anti-anti-sigma factor [Geodermatophilus dictyosporus]|uniref:Anti-anti-sigma factor n=1 Tax=Geodermatophilus dictyosporus TaxID=1523247 RepID=A0A1I5T3C7_9ACTN|nr:STAS domain-containing protein [Geodermatophilus dictyosporus]SFP77529.1 anti-anti-sigma factor [Geodermatophilus dictyosporus]